MTTTVTDAPERDRYELHSDSELVGFAAYRHRDGAVVFTHTEVDEEVEGQGLGSTLAQGALDDVRAKGQQVVPRCPFIRAWIERHPDYADLVAVA